MVDDTDPTFPEPPPAGDEAVTLVGSLERQRATFAWKCADLSDEQLRTHAIGSSGLSLGRLLKHVAYMEDLNFTQELAGAALPSPWREMDPEGRSAAVFASADEDSAETLYAVWQAAVDRSRRAITEALDRGGPGFTYGGGSRPESLRRLLVDLIEEYGRHTGHADLLREAIDGRAGEDPPGRPVPFTLR
jgi:uncharacterized damage-inducible protein DinB